MADVLGYLGLARRAGKLSIGHDAAMLSVRKGTASLVLLTTDASPRHLRELEAAGFKDKTEVIPYNMNETGVATGKKSCIYALDDEGFAKAVNKLLKEGN